ncbi:Outer membrane protein assembly factor BamB precursor [Candidatus Gullanella endobia]|uniref:Outer membrane protein assembly factor BamB n=1 Tax=Candidatus Gullanella endobia TaxID=1070130 RepID=A0A143WQ30_9ENTR|nr:Outer membrane protein assembly factor BamB precursor [Candidatus Gullanella endobia]
MFCTLLNGCSLFRNKENIVSISLSSRAEKQFQPRIVWSCSVGNGFGEFYSNLHPAWKNDRIFVADRYGVVKALDVDSGKEIWSTNLSTHTSFFSRNYPEQLSGGITVADSKIYIGSELAKIYALNVKDGSIAWEKKVAGEVLSTPVVTDNLVLIHTSNGILQALNEIDGTIKWDINLDVSSLTLRGKSSPTTAFGAAIVGGDNGRISAVMINQGQLIWQKYISQPSGSTEIARINDVKTTPVVVNGVVYALAYNGNFVALDLRSGQLMWSREIGSITNLLIDNDRIYLIDQNDRVVAMDTKGKIIFWHQSKLLHRKLTSPVLYNGYIITGDMEGYLHWISIDDGQLIAQKKIDCAGLLATPIIADNKLIVQAKNGKTYAIIF